MRPVLVAPRVIAGPLAGLAAALLVALHFGASDFGLTDVAKAVRTIAAGAPLDDHLQTALSILWTIRLPRIFVALLAGAALAAAGTVSQGLFRNPLASPSVMGSEAGASLMAAIVFNAGAAYIHWLTLPLAAFAGALAATSALYALAGARRTRAGVFGTSLATLLLAGFALNALFSASTSLFVSLLLEDQERAAAAMHWLLGGFAGKGFEHVTLILPPLALGLTLAWRLSPRLDGLQLGEEVASSLTIDLKKLQRHAFVVIALLVGAAAAVAGAVPFLGLIVPHWSRRFSGPHHRPLLLVSAINGGSLLVIADLLARILRAPRELEVGILTALLGAPFFLWLLLKGEGDKG